MGYITFLVTVCLSIIGSWYLQKNVLKGQVMDRITENAKELFELRTTVNTLAEEIEQQKKQIIDQNALIKDLESKYEESTKVKGPPDPQGVNGVPGPPGSKEDATAKGGVVYVRWGHDSCPDGGAQLVYAGRAGGSYYNHKGGGGNPQCLPLDPKFYKTVSGEQDWGYMYGAEYEWTNGLIANSHNTDIPCAVCYVPTRNALYMIPAKYECPSGWSREYFGYLMSEHYSHHRSQFSCVDHSLTPVTGSSHNHNGVLFHTVEGVCGSLPCPPYSRDKELSCAVCTK